MVVDAFYREEIGVGHALLLAKLQTGQQEQALAACFKEDWTNGERKAKRILLPVRSLQFWIESNILLILKEAPFDKRDAQLVPVAGSCVDCPKRTGHNKLLFADVRQDACTDPTCYHAKVEAHVAKAVAAKPKIVQISTAYGQQQEGSPTLPRNKYVEIRPEKPTTKEEATRPEFKTCKFTTEAIVSEGIDKGELRKVCTEPTCPVHHPRKRPQQIADDAKWKAEQEKQRKEAAIANTTGIRTLAAIAEAVPVRLMKRDLLFVAERLASLLDENRLAVVARQHGIKKAKDSDSIGKLFAAYLRRAEEGANWAACWLNWTIILSTRPCATTVRLKSSANAACRCVQGGHRRSLSPSRSSRSSLLAMAKAKAPIKQSQANEDRCKSANKTLEEREGRIASATDRRAACLSWLARFFVPPVFPP